MTAVLILTLAPCAALIGIAIAGLLNVILVDDYEQRDQLLERAWQGTLKAALVFWVVLGVVLVVVTI
jgi:hypothetical protein